MSYGDVEKNYATLCHAGNDVISAVKEQKSLMCNGHSPGIENDTEYLIVDTMRFYGYDDTEYIALINRLRDHIAVCNPI